MAIVNSFGGFDTSFTEPVFKMVVVNSLGGSLVVSWFPEGV